jgi:hypothetical protein
LGGGIEVITKDWLEYIIPIMTRWLEEAEAEADAARERLDRAKVDYNAAMSKAADTRALIFGHKDHLAYLEGAEGEEG